MSRNRSKLQLVVITLLAIGVVATAGVALATDAFGGNTGAQTQVLQENQSFDVSNLTVATDGTVTVTADIDNPDTVPMIQPVELRVDGELVEARPWALNPGETEQITFDLPADQVSDGSVISVQTRTHGEVAIYGETPPPAGPSIAFDDQVSDGSSVVVANASNDATPYYVAVWTQNATTGEPETLLGASQVTENATSNVTVAFDQPINESQTLIAAVHPDGDGNASTVDPVVDQILASDTANVTVEAGPTPTSQVYVSEVLHYRGSGNESVPNNCVFLRTTGTEPVDVGGYVVAAEGTTFTLPSNATVPADGTHVVHWNQNGTNTADDSWTGTGLGDFSTTEGEVALLSPAETNATSNVTDYVRWDVDGTWGNQDVVANESFRDAAVAAGVWDDSYVNVSGVDFTQTFLELADPAAGPGGTATAWALKPKQQPETASVTFDDQNSDGQNVTVASATLPDGGFVAITNETDILGVSSYLDAGTHEDVNVRLFHVPGRDRIRDQIGGQQGDQLQLRNQTRLQGNATLTAVLHQDTNANQSFDYVLSNETEDGPYLDAEGNPVADTANVTLGPPTPPTGATIAFDDQNSDGTSVVVTSASNQETPYYVAVWTQNASTGEPETLLGATQVTENATSNVTVNFEQSIGESQQLIAAVHPDGDGNASTVDPVVDQILASDTAQVTVNGDGVGEASITIDDQSSGGTSVVVSQTSYGQTPYYVGIYRFNTNGSGTELVGIQQVTETQTNGITVLLDKRIESGMIVAAIHPDGDGDAATFDPITDDYRAIDTAQVTVENGSNTTTEPTTTEPTTTEPTTTEPTTSAPTTTS